MILRRLAAKPGHEVIELEAGKTAAEPGSKAPSRLGLLCEAAVRVGGALRPLPRTVSRPFARRDAVEAVAFAVPGVSASNEKLSAIGSRALEQPLASCVRFERVLGPVVFASA